jgi:pyruvate/2-oxoglutarate dehydrogenase complex dihydrolipoamide acyltransferase (E2) component
VEQTTDPGIDVTFPIVPASDDYPDAGGTVLSWAVADGDRVTEGQVLAEVSVNKAVGEIVAPASGTITLLCAVSDVLVQGTALARIHP